MEIEVLGIGPGDLVLTIPFIFFHRKRHLHRASDRYHSFHQYTLRILEGQRDSLRFQLKEKGIGTGIYYPLLARFQPVLIPPGYTKRKATSKKLNEPAEWMESESSHIRPE